jgi:oligopeptide transport system permease protein
MSKRKKTGENPENILTSEPVLDADFVPVPEEKKNTDMIVRPSVSYWKDAFRRITHDKVAMVCLAFIVFIVLMAIFAPMFSKYGYETTHLTEKNMSPCKTHWFGTDSLGRDLWARIWIGARVSLAVGFFGALIPQLIGILIGGIAGYFGGSVDMVIMRIIDVGVCIPELIYITLIMLYLGSGPIPLIIAFAITGWMGTARAVRGRIMQFKNREFVMASKSLGGQPMHLIFKSIFPNILGQQIVSLTAGIPGAIFMEAYLSFIGLGIASPLTSWGQLSQTGASFYRLYPYQLFIPGIFISLTILALYLFGNSLRDALDPHLRD